ncbi:hypothetical protein LguiA_002178 [Lonicera macranthoides]
MGEKVVCNLEISRAKPYLLVILVQFGFAGMVILAKTALNQGMNHYTFAESEATNDYLNFLQDNGAGLFRASFRPELVLCGDGVYIGDFCSSYVQHSSCPYLSDGLDLSIVGTLVTVGGAMIMTLIKGHTIGLPWTKTHTINSESTSTSVHQDPTKGSIMITAVTLKTYPAELSLTTLICGGGTLQGAILTLIVEKGNTSIWFIHFDTKLLAALYSVSDFSIKSNSSKYGETCTGPIKCNMNPTPGLKFKIQCKCISHKLHNETLVKTETVTD